MRVGGNSMRRGRGGMVRSSHQITGSASRPASSHGTEEGDGAERHGAPPAAARLRLPAVVAGHALQPHDERQQRLGRRPVGVMHQERPADAARRLLDLGAVRGEPASDTPGAGVSTRSAIQRSPPSGERNSMRPS